MITGIWYWDLNYTSLNIFIYDGSKNSEYNDNDVLQLQVAESWDEREENNRCDVLKSSYKFL
jgi:hypothetical protein